MSKNKTEILNSIIDYAKTAGAHGADVILHNSASLSFKAENKKLEEYKVSSSQVTSVRVIKNNRSGISYSESLGHDSLKYMVNQALANASYAKENPHEKITIKEPKDIICTMDEETENLSMEDKINFSLALEEDLLNKGKEVKSCPYNGFTETHYSKYILNSEGSFAQHKENNYACYTTALLEQNNNNSTYGDGASARQFQFLNKEEIINNTYNTAKDLLTATPVSTGKYSVIFNAKTFPNLFFAFSSMLSAQTAIDNINPFKDKVGKSIASNTLSITDKPLYRKGMGYSTFDDEGAPREKVEIIKNGKLISFLHNTATASKLGVANTYSAYRNAKSTLDVASSNLVINKGSNTDQELYDGTVLEIIQLDGLHSGVNFISGDFSCGALGYLWKNGEKIQSVKGVTVSGNFYEMLNNIELLGEEVKSNTRKNFFSPLIRFANLTIAGN